MSKNLDDYHRRKARESIRRETVWPLFMLWMATLILGVASYFELPSARGFLLLGSAVVFAVAAVGAHRSATWARLLAGSIFGILAAYALYAVLVEDEWRRVVKVLVSGAAAAYFFSEQSKREFALARGETPASAEDDESPEPTEGYPS